MPQDDHWLARCEATTPPPPEKKLVFSRQKFDILKGCEPTLTFEKIYKYPTQFFGCFCRKFCHADRDPREQQAILVKKVEKIRPKLRFSIFPAKILARPSLTSRSPARLLQPRPIDCDRGFETPVKIFPVFAHFF